MDNLERSVFESFAQIYPQEIYALRPDEFWELFQRKCPGVSREKMESLLFTERERVSETNE